MSPKGSRRSHGTQHFKKLRLNLDIFTAKLCHGKGVMQACAAGARYATFFLSPCCMLPFPSTFDQLSPARWYLKKFPITPYRVDGIPKKIPRIMHMVYPQIVKTPDFCVFLHFLVPKNPTQGSKFSRKKKFFFFDFSILTRRCPIQNAPVVQKMAGE